MGREGIERLGKGGSEWDGCNTCLGSDGAPSAHVSAAEVWMTRCNERVGMDSWRGGGAGYRKRAT